MLRYILTNTTLAGHRFLFDRLREGNRTGDRHVFIVPDRFTLSVEKEICEILSHDTTGKNDPRKGSFSVDVTTFTRLAKKVLGKEDRACLSKEGTVLLLHRVIGEKKKELLYYGNVESVAFTREMFATIASLRSSGITAETAMEKSALIGGAVGKKLHDVALLYAAYDEARGTEYFDTVSRVDELIRRLPTMEGIRNTHVYVLGFNLYSDQQLRFLEKAIVTCASVNLAFCASEASNGQCFPGDAQRSRLVRYAEDHGCKVVEAREPRETFEGRPEFAFLHRELFSPERSVYAQKTERVFVNGYDDPYEEVRAVAREINHLVLTEGSARYKEIAVVCNDAGYAPVIAKTFRRFGIPVFIDEKFAVKNGFFARFCRQILACRISGFDPRDVMSLLRHPYAYYTDAAGERKYISREDAQAFATYCAKYAVRYGMFTAPFTHENPVLPEAIRSALATLVTSLPGKAPAYAFSRTILGWAEDEMIRRKEEEFAAGTEREQCLYADSGRFLTVVREMGALLGEREITATEFADALDALLENMTFGDVPHCADAVFVGNTEESRFSGVKVLFVAGASEGCFPVATGDPLIFGSYETAVMGANDLRVFPSPADSNFFARFALIDLVVKAGELYVSYAKTTFDGSKNNAGRGVREIKARLRLTERPFEERHAFGSEEDRLMYRLSSPENCRFEYVSGRVPEQYVAAVRGYLTDAGYFTGTEPGKEADLLQGYERADGAYKLSASNMELYFRCPFRNYLKNVLGLKEPVVGELQVFDKGTIIHDVLERYFGDPDPQQAGAFVRNATPLEETDRAAACIERVLSDPQYARFFEGSEGGREREKLRAECTRLLAALSENLRHSRLSPSFIEKYFAAGEITFTSEDGSKTFTFTGYVDRVDVDEEKNLIIIDYKTGKADGNVAPIYTGEKIQLYIYLKYFLQHGYTPLGVFYLPIKDGYDSVSFTGRRYAMTGQLREEFFAIEKIDSRAAGVHTKAYGVPSVDITVITKDGVPQYNSKKDRLFSEEGFRVVTDYVMRLIKQATEEIGDGYKERKPKSEKTCKYCPFRRLCGGVSAREEIVVDRSSFLPVEEGGSDDEVE